MNSKPYVFLFSLITTVLLEVNPALAQRGEHVDKMTAAMEAKAEQRRQEEERRAQEAAARERARIQAENEKKLIEIAKKIGSDTALFQAEIEDRLKEVNEEWLKKFSEVEGSAIRGDLEEVLREELQDYIKHLLYSPGGRPEPTPPTPEKVGSNELESERISDQTTSSCLESEKLRSLASSTSPLEPTILAEMEQHCYEIENTKKLVFFTDRLTRLQIEWSNTLKTTLRALRSSQSIEIMMNELKRGAQEEISRAQRDQI